MPNILLQYSFYQQLNEQKKSEKFFKVLYDRMRAAQQEIRSTVTVNTLDLGTKKKDEDSDVTVSLPKKRGEESGGGGALSAGLISPQSPNTWKEESLLKVGGQNKRQILLPQLGWSAFPHLHIKMDIY